VVNFNSSGLFGSIFDIDENVLQSLFPTNGTDPIGFYLELNSALGIQLFGDDIIYTQANLNPLGEDMAAEFPTLGPLDAFLISFADININTSNQVTLGSYFVAPLSSVPIPAAVWLFATALIGVFGFSKRKTCI
jgi:hypothetical protein